MPKFSCPNCNKRVSFFRALVISRTSTITCNTCKTVSTPVFWKPGLIGGSSGAISSIVIIFGSWEIIKSQGTIIGIFIALSIMVAIILTMTFVVYQTTNLVKVKDND